MRIRMLRRPQETCIDGVRLDHFEPGLEYEVGTSFATLLCAEGWAEPLEPALQSDPSPADATHTSDDTAHRRPRRRFESTRERFPQPTGLARAHNAGGRRRKQGPAKRGRSR